MEPVMPYQPDHTNPPPPPHTNILVTAPTSGMATASLVLAIVGLLGGWCAFGLPCFIAVLLGHMALKETRNGQRGGHGMAVAGLILGYPFALLWAGVGISGILGGLSSIGG